MRMEDNELDIDLSCHVLYSKPCKKAILGKIASHYPEKERDSVWEKVQKKYVSFLKGYRTDLGGKNNMHNSLGGTYDCIALSSYYLVCKEFSSPAEIEEMERAIFLPSYKRLGFVDANKTLYKKLLYHAFLSAKKRCDKWGDYEMEVGPYVKGEPIHYLFRSCPVAEFAKANGLLELMPAFCNPDYAGLAYMRAKLIRKSTCAKGETCDYLIVGDKDRFAKEHPEFVDEDGYITNR